MMRRGLVFVGAVVVLALAAASLAPSSWSWHGHRDASAQGPVVLPSAISGPAFPGVVPPAFLATDAACILGGPYNGSVSAIFIWRPALYGTEQWLDLSVMGPEFAPNTFIGTRLDWSVGRYGHLLAPNTTYYWRVNNHTYVPVYGINRWESSPTYYFTTPSC